MPASFLVRALGWGGPGPILPWAQGLPGDFGTVRLLSLTHLAGLLRGLNGGWWFLCVLSELPGGRIGSKRNAAPALIKDRKKSAGA